MAGANGGGGACRLHEAWPLTSCSTRPPWWQRCAEVKHSAQGVWPVVGRAGGVRGVCAAVARAPACYASRPWPRLHAPLVVAGALLAGLQGRVTLRPSHGCAMLAAGHPPQPPQVAAPGSFRPENTTTYQMKPPVMHPQATEGRLLPLRDRRQVARPSGRMPHLATGVPAVLGPAQSGTKTKL